MIPLFVGLVPGIGDVITTALSLYIVNEARALGAPSLLVVRMLANVALDGVVGAVPLFGDVFDVAFRANRRNLAIHATLPPVPGSATDSAIRLAWSGFQTRTRRQFSRLQGGLTKRVELLRTRERLATDETSHRSPRGTGIVRAFSARATPPAAEQRGMGDPSRAAWNAPQGDSDNLEAWGRGRAGPYSFRHTAALGGVLAITAGAD